MCSLSPLPQTLENVASMSLLVWNLSKKCPYLAQMMSKAGKNESISAVNCFTSTMQLCKINSNPCLLILVIKNRFQIFIWSVWPTFTSFNISYMKTCSSAPKSPDDKRYFEPTLTGVGAWTGATRGLGGRHTRSWLPAWEVLCLVLNQGSSRPVTPGP